MSLTPPTYGLSSLPIKDLDKFIAWARANLADAAINWDYAIGKTYARCGHSAEGLEVLKSAESHPSARWQTLSSIAQASVSRPKTHSQAVIKMLPLLTLLDFHRQIRASIRKLSHTFLSLKA